MPQQHLVCELRRKGCIQRLPTQEQAVEDRSVERVDSQLEIGVRPELPPLPASLERFTHRPPSRRHDIAVEPFRQLRIVLQVGDEPGEDTATDRLREHGHQPAKQLAYVLVHIAAVGRRLKHRVGAPEIRLERQCGARRPPAVDRLLADSRARGDPLDRQLPVAQLDQQLLRRGDDRLMGALTPASSHAPTVPLRRDVSSYDNLQHNETYRLEIEES